MPQIRVYVLFINFYFVCPVYFAKSVSFLPSVFGHGERKHDNDWVKCCMTWKVEGITQGGRPKKTSLDCVKG